MAATLPGYPITLKQTASSSTSITFEWFDPASNGGTPVTDYSVFWNKGVNGGVYEQLSTSTLGKNNYTKQSGLTAGLYYDFKVRAKNAIGDGPYSSLIRIIAASAAGPPTNLVKKSSSKTSVAF